MMGAFANMRKAAEKEIQRTEARRAEKAASTPKQYSPSVGERDNSVVGQMVTDNRMAYRQESKSDNSLWRQTEKDRAESSTRSTERLKQLREKLKTDISVGNYDAIADTQKTIDRIEDSQYAVNPTVQKIQDDLKDKMRLQMSLGDYEGMAKTYSNPFVNKRLGNILGGAAKQSAGATGSAFAVTTEGMLSGGRKTARGESMKQLEALFDKDKAIQTTQDFREKTIGLTQSGLADVEKAKMGLGSLGRLGVDTAAGMTQLGIDIGIGAATGMGAMPSLAVRAFGGAADQAKADGASIDQQIVYGLANAAVEVATERISSSNIISSKAFGKGTLDDLMTGIVAGLEDVASTEKGRAIMNRVGSILTSGMGEGLEEGIAGVLEPFIATTTYGKEFEMNWEDIGYQVLVGALTGAITGVSGQNTNEYRAKVAENQQSVNPPSPIQNPVDTAQAFNYDKGTQQAVEKAQNLEYGKPAETKTATVLDAGTTAYVQLGMKPKRAEAKAKVVQKLINGEQVSLDGMKSLNLTDAKYRAVFTQLTGVVFPEDMTNHDQLMNVAKTASEVRNNVAAEEAPVVPVAEAQGQEIPSENVRDIPQDIHQPVAQVSDEVGETDIMSKGVASRDSFAEAYRATRNNQAEDPEIDAEYGKYLDRVKQAKDEIAVSYKGQPVTRKQFRDAFRAGNPNSTVTDAELNAMFARELERQVAQAHNDAGVGTTKTGGKGLFRDSGGAFRKIDIDTQKLLDKIGKKTGLAIVIHDKLYTPSGKKARGSYSHSAKELHLSLDAGDAMMQVLRHELTHYLQDSKGKVYDGFVKFVRENVPDFDARFEATAKKYEGVESNEQRIVDEVMSEYVEKLFTDEQFIEMIVKQDRTLAEKLFDAIKALAKKLHGIDDGLDSKIAAGQKLWESALNEATEGGKYNARQGKEAVSDRGRTGSDGKRHALGQASSRGSGSLAAVYKGAVERILQTQPSASQKVTPGSRVEIRETAEEFENRVFDSGMEYFLHENGSLALGYKRAVNVPASIKGAKRLLEGWGMNVMLVQGDIYANLNGVTEILEDGATLHTSQGPIIFLLSDTTLDGNEIAYHELFHATRHKASQKTRAEILGILHDSIDVTDAGFESFIREIADIYAYNTQNVSPSEFAAEITEESYAWYIGTLFSGNPQIEPLRLAQFSDVVETKRRLAEVYNRLGGPSGSRFNLPEESGVSYDEKTESVSPTRFSLDTWNESDYVTARADAAKAMSEALGITQKKAKAYIDSVNSIAKMIANDRVRLDYEASPGRSSFVSNAEYGGSIDFSTICKKRRLFTGTFEAIQKALPNTALTAEEFLEIRSMMDEKGYEVSCGLCYVEGSRANMGQYAKQFLEQYEKTSPEYMPNMAEINTPDGLERIRAEHPEVYAAYEKFMNGLAQRKPKLYQTATAYQGEVLNKFGRKGGKVEEKNYNGGLRLQSFSDFEIIHLIDCMQVIMDMSRVGLAGQAYTKVPDFAWALGDTGLKINLSLISKGVDSDGKIILDEKEGMSAENAFALRDRYSENVGTVLVVFSDEQLKAALADEQIDYVLPFHRSQWRKDQYEVMGLPSDVKDYTPWQNESYIKPVLSKSGKKQRPDNFMPNTYWDFSKSGKENAETYLRMCAEGNRKPKFSHLLVDNKDGSYSLQPDGSTDGYWKLLIDFKMYDNDGKGVPQRPVRPDFNMEQANRMLEEYKGGHSRFPAADDVVSEFVEQYKRNHPGVRYSVEETDSDFPGDTNSEGELLTREQVVYFKDSVVRDESGNLKIMYHGTSKGGHNIFDPYGKAKYGLFGLGTYFTDNRDVAESYTNKGKGNNKQVYETYLNILNPMDMDVAADPSAWKDIFPDADFPASGTNEQFYRAMEEYFRDQEYYKWEAEEAAVDAIMSMGYDGITHIGGGRFNKHDDTRHRVYVAFQPEQIKRTDNLNPTDDPDIRYAVDSADDFDAAVQAAFEAAYQESLKTPPTAPASQADSAMLGWVIYNQSVGAASLRFDPYTYLLNEYGAIEQTGKHNHRVADVPKSTDGKDKISKTTTTVMGAKATPESRLTTIAQAVVDGELSYEPITNKITERKMHNKLTKDGWDDTLASWTKAVHEGKSGADLVAMGATLLNNAGNSGMDGKAYIRLMTDYAQLLRNAGQSLQAANIFKKMSPEGKLYGIQKQIEEMNTDELTKKLTGQSDIVMSDELAQRYLAAQTDEERDILMEMILQDIANQVPATFVDKFKAWRYTAMLGNFRTMIRNVSGNALMQPVRSTKTVFAALGEALMQKAGVIDERTTGLTRDKETLKAAVEDFQNVKDIIAGGGRYRDDNSKTDLSAEIRKRQRVFKNALLEGYRKTTQWAMDNEWFGDEAFSRIAYRDALARYIAANGLTWSQASEEMKDRARVVAIREAAESTYRDNNDFSDLVTSIRFRNPDTSAKKFANAMLEGVLPFKKTPANILVRSIEYSPIGFANAVRHTLSKNPDRAVTDVINEYAKGLTGTSILALGMGLAALGMIRGKAPDDEKEKELWEMQGHQEYSLEIGGTSYTIDWAAPLSIPLLVGAELFEALQSEGLTVREMSSVASSVFDPLLEMSMLQGINDAISNAQTWGDESALVRFTGNALWSYLSQVVPTLLGQMERSSVNERTTTYADKNKDVPDAVQRALGKVSAKIPGWDYAQTVYIDAWGRTQANAANRGFNALEQFFSPGYANAVTESAMESELLRLKKVTGESGVLIASAPKYFTVDNARKDLTADEYLVYAVTRGQTAYSLLTRMTGSSAYTALTDDQKVDAVVRAYDYANQIAKEQITNKKAKVENWVSEARTNAAEYGVDVSTYLTAYAAMKDWTGLKDKKGNTVDNSLSYRKAVEIQKIPDLTNEQQVALAKSLGCSSTVTGFMESNPKIIPSKWEGLKKKYG